MDGKQKDIVKIIAVTLAICLVFEALLFCYMGIYMGGNDKSFPFESVVPKKAGEIKIAAEKDVTQKVGMAKVKAESEAKKKQAAERKAKLAAKKKQEAEEKQAAEKEREIPELAPLKKQILAELKGKEGSWSVYVNILDNGDSFTINERYSRSASLIKLFVAGAYLKAVKDGDLKETAETEENLRLMISESSNDAWVELESSLRTAYASSGASMVEDFIYENGYRHSERDTGGESMGNMTSVEDVGRVLELVYKGEYVSREASDKILKYMKAQDHRAKIPAGIPEGITVANKTGELDDVENDAAIVFTNRCDYILVVMADNVNYELLGVPEIKKVSEMVYDHIAK